MEIIKFYQEAFLLSAEKLLSAEAETRKMLERIARELEKKIAKDLVGKEFYSSDLFGKDDWYYKAYQGHVFKAVVVKADVTSEIMKSITDDYHNYRNPVNLNVFFMRNPNTELESKKNLTAKEISLLKELKWWWGVNKGESADYKRYDGRSIDGVNRDLSELKHNLRMVGRLSWTYDLSQLTDEELLERGLRAEVDIC